MENEIKWIGKDLPELPHHRAGQGELQKFCHELKKRPNEWALYKIMPKGKKFSGGNQNQMLFPGTKWSVRTIDGLMHVFAKWNGQAD